MLTTHINHLPPEVFTNIFSHINPFIVRGVCKYWEEMLSKNYLYSDIFAQICTLNPALSPSLHKKLGKFTIIKEIKSPHLQLLTKLFIERIGYYDKTALKNASFVEMFFETNALYKKNPPLDAAKKLDVLKKLHVLPNSVFETLTFPYRKVDISIQDGFHGRQGKLDAIIKCLSQLHLLSNMTTTYFSFSGLSFDRLSLCNTQLDAIPSSIGKLPQLSQLSLVGNRLRELPPSIEQLIQLNTLVLSHNRLESLPGSLCKIKTLRKLDLSNNQLVILPEFFGALTNLMHLDLSHNPIEALPETFGNLSTLSLLELNHTHLTALPSTLSVSNLPLRTLNTLLRNISFRPLCYPLKDRKELRTSLYSTMERFFLITKKLDVIKDINERKTHYEEIQFVLNDLTKLFVRTGAASTDFNIFELVKQKLLIHLDPQRDLDWAWNLVHNTRLLNDAFIQVVLEDNDIIADDFDASPLLLTFPLSREELDRLLAVRTAGPLNVLHDMLYRLQYPNLWMGKPITVANFKVIFAQIDKLLSGSESFF